MPSIVRLLVAAAAGFAVLWLLMSGAGAQTDVYPVQTAQAATRTAQAGVPTQTPQGGVPTQTPQGGVPTQTPTATPAAARASAQVVPANATAIAGDRGRVANVRPNSFSVLWTTDATVAGQVNFGTSASLGSTAADMRGTAFTGRTHYVDVTGLAPNTVYFFDLVSGGQADNNGGQHYQIKTAPNISGSPPSGNAVVGQVLNPGGGAPAAGALIWAAVRDGNGQGTGGTSQLLGTLSGGDGRFNLLLQPRTGDLNSYFVYQNEGDAVDLSARGEQGVVDLSVNTAVTQGGTQPGDVRLVLNPTPAGASPTVTPTPVPSGATPAPTSTTGPTVRPGAPTPVPVAPSPTSTPASAPVQAPVQMPSLREQLLQVGPYPGPGAAPTAAPPPTQLPTKPPPPPTAAKPAPPPPASPTAQPAPGAVAPAGAVPGGPPLSGAVPAAPLPTAPAALPPTGVKAPGAGAFGTGQPAPAPAPAPAPRDSFAQPVGSVATPVAPGGPLGTLASLPALISGLFYGGIVVIALGAGLAIWSILNGTGWRPR